MRKCAICGNLIENGEADPHKEYCYNCEQKGGIMPKICVYGICYNEANKIDKFMEGVKDADLVCFLDTGSTDNTVKKFESWSSITPVYVGSISNRRELFVVGTDFFHFGIARQTAGQYAKDTISALGMENEEGIFLTLDVDEYLQDEGIRMIKEEGKSDATFMSLNYCYLKNNIFYHPVYPGMKIKIHADIPVYWANSCIHETLVPADENYVVKTISSSDIFIFHDSNFNDSKYTNQIVYQRMIEPNNPSGDFILAIEMQTRKDDAAVRMYAETYIYKYENILSEYDQGLDLHKGRYEICKQLIIDPTYPVVMI